MASVRCSFVTGSLGLATWLSLKWKLTNPRHATSRNFLQISRQPPLLFITFYSYDHCVAILTSWEITRLLCDTRQVSWGKSLHFLFSLKLMQSTMDVNLVIKLLSCSLKRLDQLSTKSHASPIFTQLQKLYLCRMETFSLNLLILLGSVYLSAKRFSIT